MVKIRESAGRSLFVLLAKERKVRAPQDTVVGNAHRPRTILGPSQDRESATESIPPGGLAFSVVSLYSNPAGKGEKVGGRS